MESLSLPTLYTSSFFFFFSFSDVKWDLPVSGAASFGANEKPSSQHL